MASEDGNSQPKEQSRGGGLLQAWIHSGSEGVEAKSVKTFSAVVFPANPCNDFWGQSDVEPSISILNPGKSGTLRGYKGNCTGKTLFYLSWI